MYPSHENLISDSREVPTPRWLFPWDHHSPILVLLSHQIHHPVPPKPTSSTGRAGGTPESTQGARRRAAGEVQQVGLLHLVLAEALAPALVRRSCARALVRPRARGCPGSLIKHARGFPTPDGN